MATQTGSYQLRDSIIVEDTSCGKEYIFKHSRVNTTKWNKSWVSNTKSVFIAASLIWIASTWYSITTLTHSSQDQIEKTTTVIDFSPDSSDLQEKLLSYKNLKDNWDKEGALAPKTKAVNDALAFLQFKPSDVRFPYPEVGSEGEVGVYWNFKKKDMFAEVIFKGDGKYEYYAVLGTPTNISKDCSGEDLSVNENWHENLVEILRS
ncbi:MAG: hypothetical protein OXO49_09115 [Gammaproteobacteria bacterium]|nr:hypothetical protein [Gammaproteobacteria bacterium]MDE0252740.1 hypothetical protein [Gammaproteobacteria bacterium]MDE0402244.1 hypothetical protein [Gammaproteobacteria bacterium]